MRYYEVRDFGVQDTRCRIRDAGYAVPEARDFQEQQWKDLDYVIAESMGSERFAVGVKQ